MNNELDLLGSILDKSDVQTLSRFLEFCEETRLFSKHTDACADFVSTINRLLNESHQRLLGALLLKTFLPQCPRSLAGQHVFNWINTSIRGILTVDEDALVDVSLNVLTSLIPMSLEFPDVKKDVSQNLSSRIVECLIRDLGHSQHKLQALKCLHQFLMGYGKSCGQFKESLSKYLLGHIDYSPDIVHAAGQCFLSLAAVGSPGPDFDNYKTSWETQQTLLINCLNYVLNGLFEGVGEVQGPSNPVTLKEIDESLPVIPDKLPLARAMKRAGQFKGLGEFLCSMVSGKFIAYKKLSLESLLSVICRTLAFNCDTIKSNLSTDSLYLSIQVPILHETAIRILSALIACCRMNLVTHGELICKLLGQILKCTQVDGWPYGRTKPFWSLRASAYNCLQLWLSVSRSSSNVKASLPDIVNALAYDICAVKPVVQIHVQTKHMKGKEGKRRRQAMMMNGLSDEVDKSFGDRQEDCELYIASLKCLSTLFLFSGAQIDLKDAQKLVNEIVQHLLTLETQNAPYDNEDCRLELYTTLFAVCSLRIPRFVPPLNVAYTLFMEGLKDPSSKVVGFCGFAACQTSRIIQPIAPTLEFQPIAPSAVPAAIAVPPPTRSTILSPISSRSVKPAKKLKIKPKPITQPGDAGVVVVEREPSPVQQGIADRDDEDSEPTLATSHSSSLASTVTMEGNEENDCLVTKSPPSSSRRVLESDDSIEEIEPSDDENTNKRPNENGFEPELKRAKSSTLLDVEEPVPRAKGDAARDVAQDVPIEQDLNELEKDMLNSFVNVIEE